MSTAAELGHLFRALKAPAAARALPKLVERAGAEEWSYERFAEELLGTERSSREAYGGEARIKAARFCTRALWLDAGAIRAIGQPHRVVDDYLQGSASLPGAKV